VKAADDVGIHEVIGPVDGPVDVTFGSKVHNRPRLVLREQFSHGRGVANVRTYKNVPGIREDFRKTLQISGIGKLVDVDYGLIVVAQPLQYKVCANESRTAGDKYGQVMLQYEFAWQSIRQE